MGLRVAVNLVRRYCSDLNKYESQRSGFLPVLEYWSYRGSRFLYKYTHLYTRQYGYLDDVKESTYTYTLGITST